MGRLALLLTIVALAATTCVTALAGAQTAPGVTAHDIVIGGTFPLTGAASYYAPVAVGMKVYFTHLNASRGKDGKRGIGGRQIVWKYYDDGYNAANTMDETQKLVEEDHVLALFGALGTAPQLAVVDWLNRSRSRSAPAAGPTLQSHFAHMATVDDDRREYSPIPYSRERRPYEDALAASESFLRLMQQRRSIRHFSTEPVPRELVENAVRTAASAPSGANQQPWTFVVVSNAETKERIRVAAEREEELLYHGRASDEYLGAIKPIGTNEHKPHISDAPYIIVVFEQAWGHNPDGSKRKHYYVRESVGIAVGLLLASLHTAGLATLTHAPSPMGFLKEILGRPENERPFLLIPVGYPAADAEVPDLMKKDHDDVAVYVDEP